MRFEYWFSRRMRLRRGASASTSTGVVIAVAGVALALMVMELSLAVAAGFKHEIERKMFGFDAPVSVMPAYDYYTGTTASQMEISDTLTGIIAKAMPDYSQVATMRQYSILKTDSDYLAVECIARDSKHDSSFERSNIVDGVWPTFASGVADSIVISCSMASKLQVATGDRLFMYFFADDAPKVRRATIAGVYQSNFGEYDNSVIYAPLTLLQRLSTDAGNIGTSISIEGVQKDDIDDVSEILQDALVDAFRDGNISEIYTVTNIFNTGAVFFSWLDLLDTNVIVIFILMTCVAAFTLISSLFIIILDRVSTIGLLRSLGASKRCVSRIFVNVAMRLVGLGMIIGNILGLGIILIQNCTHIIPLDPQMYYLAFVPFEISLPTILMLNAGTAAVAWCILILPARLAARIDAAKTMRYE